jgi:nucleoside-diphosphate-sugar epimerase
LQAETLQPALKGIDVAYYLIHSMSGRVHGFESRDRQAAHNFAIAAKQCGVRRVIYLGGLAATGSTVSAHLKSRHETGAVLRKFGPPLIELRAGNIVGNGSTSFEIIRCLTERLPLMICPRWVVTKTQPIAVSDVLEYLEAALVLREAVNEPIEVGGSTVETYRSMMIAYARHRGLHRLLLRVPVLTPRLSYNYAGRQTISCDPSNLVRRRRPESAREARAVDDAAGHGWSIAPDISRRGDHLRRKGNDRRRSARTRV